MEQLLPNFLKQRSFLTPNRLALIFEDHKWSFSDLYQKAEFFARKIATFGIGYQNSVAILLKNRPHTVIAIHALQQLGLSTVFINHRLTPNEMVFQLKDSGVKLIISEDDFQGVINEISDLFEGLTTTTISEIDKLIPTNYEVLQEFPLDDVCSIMYTSGTTGKPKGVLQTFGNHWWSATGSALNLGLKEDDCWLCSVPLFHISGLSILMRSVIYGIPVHLCDQFDEIEMNQLLKSGNITIMSVVSTMLNRMISALKERNDRYHENFRCMLLGGGPAPKSLLEACIDKGIPVFQSYGMTETSSQIVTLSPEDSLIKLGSAGKPLFPAQLKIMVQGKVAAANEPGEIVVKGPNVTIGYLNRDDAILDHFENGWFYTGDIGLVDNEGYLFVLDRRSDLIISGGENIYPAEIEEVLLSHPHILEAGVTGIDHSQWGQVPYGFVVASASTSESELRAYCGERLANYKIPNKIIFVSSLPRNASNKLLRRKLKEMISEGEFE